ncbi:MAG: CRISPR-associated endonuclease Cas2 [Chloroflexi bacterium]|nr:MAG: CRISPR-associated endonuclease Cas2 [Chloroflexota bacterium]RLC96204.1 MAG: CRISPR-associated endonuclease Cas2 [Chloroflexota bacterium]
MFIVVCYDIPDDRRRTRVGKTLEGFGYRVQKSVFECEVDVDLYQRMRDQVGAVIDPQEDGVRYYSLCQSCLSKVVIAGLGEVQREKPFFAV